MYFREFGIPARIARCYNIDQLEEKIQEYNGKKSCYTSVYVFDDSTDKVRGKTNYDSAVLNTIWFDFDDEKNVKKCLMDVRRFIRQYCKPNDISYRGQGLSNEYRPMVARGLIGYFEKRHAKKLLDLYKKQIQIKNS